MNDYAKLFEKAWSNLNLVCREYKKDLLCRKVRRRKSLGITK